MSPCTLSKIHIRIYCTVKLLLKAFVSNLSQYYQLLTKNSIKQHVMSLSKYNVMKKIIHHVSKACTAAKMEDFG